MAAFTLTITGLSTDVVAIPVTAGGSAIVAGRGISPAGTVPDTTDAAGEELFGLTLHPTLAGGKVMVVNRGTVYVSNTLSPGQSLVLVGSTGQFDYESNLASGERYLLLGHVTSADTLEVQVRNTTYQKP